MRSSLRTITSKAESVTFRVIQQPRLLEVEKQPYRLWIRLVQLGVINGRRDLRSLARCDCVAVSPVFYSALLSLITAGGGAAACKADSSCNCCL
eukprot:IDg241t1